MKTFGLIVTPTHSYEEARLEARPPFRGTEASISNVLAAYRIVNRKEYVVRTVRSRWNGITEEPEPITQKSNHLPKDTSSFDNLEHSNNPHHIITTIEHHCIPSSPI
jgi:hypothetical protein